MFGPALIHVRDSLSRYAPTKDTSAITALVVALLFAAARPYVSESPASPRPALIRGKSNAVLFITHAESGQINVELATAQALMETRPKIDIHFASFPRARAKVDRVSALAVAKTKAARPITFHKIPGPERFDALLRGLGCAGEVREGETYKSSEEINVDECIAHAPGIKGMNELAAQLQCAVVTWPGPEHFAIF
ncbi:hypothetical protein F5Y16DRAFT_396268 [Xylariaceae sp. FL0255]|nr:hypothetical protein F5Y16DRAFT_396268 [Xylariaceae sp. FL0255]